MVLLNKVAKALPVFDAEGDGAAARAYLVEVKDRFLNPYLGHRLADIFKNHVGKLQRRIFPVVERAIQLNLPITQPKLRHALIG